MSVTIFMFTCLLIRLRITFGLWEGVIECWCWLGREFKLRNWFLAPSFFCRVLSFFLAFRMCEHDNLYLVTEIINCDCTCFLGRCNFERPSHSLGRQFLKLCEYLQREEGFWFKLFFKTRFSTIENVVLRWKEISEILPTHEWDDVSWECRNCLQQARSQQVGERSW